MGESVMSAPLYAVYSTGRRTVLYALSLCLLSPVLSAPFTDQAPLAKHTVLLLPSRTDHLGRHTSYDLLTQLPSDADHNNNRQYFKLETLGRVFRLNVSDSAGFMSSGHSVAYHSREDGVRTSEPSLSNCHHLTGTVREETADGEMLQEDGWAAISNCGGLRGVISTVSGYRYIEPLGAIPKVPHTHPQQHVLYSWLPSETTGCAYDKTMSYEDGDASSREEVRVRRSPDLTSISSEHYVEVAVVADRSMLEYHGVHELEAYIFTLMNMVAHIYRHPSIGHAMNILLVRTVILETDQDGLSISSDALNSLGSFCSWQSANPLIGAHRDLTLLLTRTNICEGFGSACDTLGIAEFRGACNPEKSCSITEDIGLATAFTIAHELGHNLGIRHDGDMSVDCHSDSHYIMAPSFAQSYNPHIWSHCSRQQLAEFLLSPENTCLANQPEMAEDNSSSLPPAASASSPLPLSLPLPGLETTPTEQCQLRFGEQASHCSPNTTTDFCRRLWCRENDQSDCSHHHIPPAPGTGCTIPGSRKGGVCYQGECVEFGSLIDPVDGGWGAWGEWEECSLSCGSGVQGSSRSCDSPVPANGGRYCLGPSHRHQTCNNIPCPTPNDIRQELCETEPPHSRYTQWQAPSLEYISRQGLDQCSHHCLAKPNDILFTLTMGLPDGTPCLYTSPPSPSHSLQLSVVPESLGVCVSGECVPVGCDDTLHSMASRDACGMWCGNGSSCVSVSDTYTIPKDNSNTSDYVYHQTVTLPRGSGQVKISELQPTHNLYLAAMTTTEYFNGNYRVKDAELSSYWFAGAKWWYERPDHGIECLRTSGILKDDVTIFIIANSQNLSIHYSAGIPPNNATIFTIGHVWETGKWGECESACGEGVRRRRVECVKGDAAVNDSYCDSDTKPHSQQTCSTDDGCEYEWYIGPWSDCNSTCGEGERDRQVHCLLTNNSTAVDSGYCDNETIPRSSVQCYSEEDCVFEWQTGEWSTCTSVCGEGERERTVACILTNNQTQVSSNRCVSSGPDSHESCFSERGCQFEWVLGGWTRCSATCGTGVRTRDVTCSLVNNRTAVQDSLCDLTGKSSTEAQCYSEDGCVYEWNTTVWSSCSVGCGYGERGRDVVCILRANDTVVERRFCEEREPDSRAQCYSEDDCVYRWWYGNWTSCSTDCGHGTRLREIACYLTNNDTRVDSDHCSSATPPAEVTGCYDESGCVFTWVSEPWSECNATCGTGYRTRGVACILTSNMTTVADAHCPTAGRPSVSTRCYSERDCVFMWQSTVWSVCSAVCGGGERRREVSCLLTDNNTVVDRAHCAGAGPEPVGVASCGGEECLFEWRVGEWGVCAGDSCEDGRRWRDVECILVNNQSVVGDSQCSSVGERPDTSSACQAEVCQYVWVVGVWGGCDVVCGEGAREREVYCEVVNGKGGRRRVERERCSGSEMPQDRDSCSAEPCSNFVWATGEWTECDADCDEYGTQTRTVTCQHENGTVVPERPYCTARTDKPATVRRCQSDPCPSSCVDSPNTSCAIIVRIRLCYLEYLRNLCCHSCSRA